MANPLKRKADDAFSDSDGGDSSSLVGVLKPRNKKKKKVLGLMDLPAELRNKVYEFALTDNRYAVTTKRERDRAASYNGHQLGRLQIRLQTAKKFEPKLILTPKIHEFLGILQANKQVNKEASGILYSQPLRFKDVLALQKFLLRISPAALSLVQDISIVGIEHPSARPLNVCHPTMALLKNAVNLRKFFIEYGAYLDLRDHDFKTVDLLRLHLTQLVSQQEACEVLGRLLGRQLYYWCQPYVEHILANGGSDKVKQVCQFGVGISHPMIVQLDFKDYDNIRFSQESTEAVGREVARLHQDRAYRKELMDNWI